MYILLRIPAHHILTSIPGYTENYIQIHRKLDPDTQRSRPGSTEKYTWYTFSYTGDEGLMIYFYVYRDIRKTRSRSTCQYIHGLPSPVYGEVYLGIRGSRPGYTEKYIHGGSQVYV